MTVVALAAALVAGAFSVTLAVRFARSRRAPEAIWAAAMAMYAVASLALFVGASTAWDALGVYRLYWLFGAVLNVPYLAAGEICLLNRRRGVMLGVSGVLGVLSTVAVFVVFSAEGHLGVGDLPRGSEVWRDSSSPRALARIYSYGAYALLLAGTLWSAFRMRGKPELRRRFWGVLLIAAGATIVAGGSAFAATGNLPGFSATLLVGICVMFAGFLVSSRREGVPVAAVNRVATQDG